MKRDLGWIAGPAIALAAAFGASSLGTHAADGTADREVAAQVSRHVQGESGHEKKTGGASSQELPPGPCHEMAGLLRDFFALEEDARFGPASCGPDEKGASLASRPHQNVRFIVASLMDPIHTHLPLMFDRNMDAIQEAVQDSGYVYDSSWLPWEQSETTPALLADKDALEKRRHLREDQPGIVLFRKTANGAGRQEPKSADSGDPFHDALVLFVVGDEATSGISLTQFHNAVEWIARLQPMQGGSPAGAVQILGPSFSGSFPSLTKALARNLDSGKPLQSVLVPGPDQHLDIFSGQVKSLASATWFQQQAAQEPLSRLSIHFHSFQQDSETMQKRYVRYLDSIGIGGCHLAIVTEDETVFGSAYKDRNAVLEDRETVRRRRLSARLREKETENSKQQSGKPDSQSGEQGPKNDAAPTEAFCDYAAAAPETDDPGVDRFTPTVVYYPRDISALRAAYQEQSLFRHGPAQGSADSVRHTLRDDLTDPDAAFADSIPRYGGNQTALSEEAILLQIVSILRFHEIHFILLRSTNTLDQLFLSEFFKRTYPEGRVVVLDSDLLLRRDVGSNGMNGVTVLGTYPLLPASDHWTTKLLSHQHRAFPQSNVMGTYAALRFLLRTPLKPPAGEKLTPEQQTLASCLEAQDTQLFVPPTCGDVEIPNYAPPAWNQPYGALRKSPVTWLAVLGNDGFWPVATLDERSLISGGRDDPRDPMTVRLRNLWRRAHHWPATVWESVRSTSSALVHGDRKDSSWRPMPLSMKITLAVLLGFCVFHVFCCGYGSLTVKPSHRAYFVRLRRFESTRVQDKGVRDRMATHPRSHLLLIVLSAALLSVIGTMLAWSYGWMSPYGETVLYAGLYAWVPVWIWCLGAFAVALNVWTETRYDMQPAPRGSYLADMLTPAALAAIARNIVWPLLAYTALTAGFYVFYLINLDSMLPSQVRTLTYLRAMNLTTGVSPVVPLVILAIGMYSWCWHALRGLALFGEDRPLLPSENDLWPGHPKQETVPDDPLLPARENPAEANAAMEGNPYLPLSAEGTGKRIEEICFPFHRWTCIVAGICVVVIFLASQMISPGIPLRSLGTRRFAFVVLGWMTFIISVMLANAWQIGQLWLRLRVLLDFLDKLPLRRTLQALRGFSWGSIWNMSGHVLDVRHSILHRQFEAVDHFRALCGQVPAPFTGSASLLPDLDEFLQIRNKFALWYSNQGQKWWRRDFEDLQEVQETSAALAGKVFARILVPAWKDEHTSLLILPPDDVEDAEAEAHHMKRCVADLPAEVRAAEEIFCLQYLGFIQNVLGRMRTLAVGMTCLFLSIALMIPSYPFDPRPLLAGVVVLLFLIVGGVIFFVYQGLFRDSTLSHITNTKPGELGSEFWLKFLSFGVGPVFGLLATVFPQVSDFFFSWLEPSLSSVK